MGQKNCKVIFLEVPHKLHAEIKKQATIRNITMRAYVLRCVLPVVIKDKELTKGEK